MKNINYNYEGFNPEGASFPPVGEYVLCLMSATAMQKGTSGYTAIQGEPYGVPDAISMEFEVASGPQSKQKFKMMYFVGHSNQQTSQIAFETIGRIYWAATGSKPDRGGLDITKAFFKPFLATLEKTTSKEGKEYHGLKGFKSLKDQQQSQQPSSATPKSDAPWNG